MTSRWPLDVPFRPVSLDDRAALEPRLRAASYRLCEYTFPTLVCWQPLNLTDWAVLDDWLLLRYRDHGHERFLCPVGTGDARPVVEWCFRHLESRGHPGHVGMIPEGRCAELAETCWLEMDKGNFDYLYLRSDLETLPGKPFSRKRNHVARFLKSYPSWSYEPIAPALTGECLRFVDEWCHTNECGKDRLLAYEVRALGTCLECQERLGVHGGVLRVDGRIVGLSVGEPLAADTFVVHYEKALRDIEGAYPMLAQQLTRSLPPEFTFVDREQDLGLDGLRKAKESWFPIALEPAFTATPRRELEI